jgi:tRNA-Thr(GGU) m(6)t(6)A37 methyltransferase TsaA
MEKPMEKKVAGLLTCEPIGYFSGSQSEKYMAHRQATLGKENSEEVIILNPGCNFEQALEDLTGFDHIWIIYWLHRAKSWKPKVNTPRGGKNRGVFATRSPHRPNPIGLSCVELLSIKGRKIYIGKNDLLDHTPILDIKPYLIYADSFPESTQGWASEIPKNQYILDWSFLAEKQAQFIESHQHIQLIDAVAVRLQNNPFPFKNHRIKHIKDNIYELAIKTWRLLYSINNTLIKIHKIYSGYDEETLTGKKLSRWDDVTFHLEFLKLFPKNNS